MRFTAISCKRGAFTAAVLSISTHLLCWLENEENVIDNLCSAGSTTRSPKQCSRGWMTAPPYAFRTDRKEIKYGVIAMPMDVWSSARVCFSTDDRHSVAGDGSHVRRALIC